MNLTFHKYYLSLLGSLLLVVSTSIAVNAQENIDTSQQLSLSLDSKQNSIIYLSKNNQNSESHLSRREYTFKAPDSKVLMDAEQLTQIQGYKVEVYGDAPELLQQVRDIEPKAFIKGDLIQVGIFSTQDNAEELASKLAVAGFWSRVVVH